MMDTTKTTLQLRFKGTDEKVHSFGLVKAAPNLDQQTVERAMTEIIELKLFSRNGVEIYNEPVGAEYVTTSHRTVFVA
jgi:hypothetical protein